MQKEILKNINLFYQRFYIFLIAIYVLLNSQNINPFFKIPKLIHVTLLIISIISIIYSIIDIIKNKKIYDKKKKLGLIIDIFIIIMFNIIIINNIF